MMLSGILGGLDLPVLPVMLTVGAIGMCVCACQRRTRFNLAVWQCILFTILLTCCGVAGAKLLYFLESGEFGGVSFYGSVFLIPVLMPLAGMLFRLKPGQSMDICGPCVAIMIGCLRFSCFLTGCCGGWTVCLGHYCFAWPTQMMDSIGDFAIMLWLLHAEEKNTHKGKLYPMFMIAYSSMRFFLEFLRDTPKDWLSLSHGQWFSVGAIVIGILWLITINMKRSRCGNTT